MFASERLGHKVRVTISREFHNHGSCNQGWLLTNVVPRGALTINSLTGINNKM